MNGFIRLYLVPISNTVLCFFNDTLLLHVQTCNAIDVSRYIGLIQSGEEVQQLLTYRHFIE